MSEAKIVLSAVDETKAAFQSVASSLSGLKTSATSVTAVLGALGVAGAAAAFAGTIKGAIDAADQINKLSQRTGIAAEQLSQLQFAAKLSDVSTESLTAGIKKLNISIAEGLGGDKAKVEMFKNLGISLKDASGHAISADKALLAMAGSFSTAKDGATKTAYAVGLMGKAGDEMIPLLNGGTTAMVEMMDQANKLGLTISTDFARQAEAFNDNLAIVNSSSQRLAISLAGDLVSGLGATIKAMAEASVEGGKLAAIMAGIQTLFTGDDRHKANVAMVDLADGILNAENALTRLLAKGAMQTGQDAATVRQLQEKLKLMREEYEMHRRVGQEIDKQTEKTAAAAPKQTGNLKTLTGGGTGTVSEYEKLNVELQKRIQLEEAELAFGGKLSDSRKFEVEALEKIATVHKKLTAAQEATLKGKVAEAKQAIEANALRDAEFKQAMDIAQARQAARAAEYEQGKALVIAEMDAVTARNKVGRETLEQLEFDTKALTMNAEERERATATRELERQGIVKGTEAWDKYYEAIMRASTQKAATQTAVDDFKSFWDSIDRTGHDVFTNIGKSGTDMWKRLKDTGKSIFLDFMYQLTARKWLFNFAASVTGTSSGIANAAVSGMGGTTSGGSIGSTAISTGANYLYGGAVSAMGAGISGASAAMAGGATFGTTGAIGGYAAAMGTGGVGVAGAAGSMMAGASAALAAIPVAGWIALAAIALYSAFGSKGGGPKTEGGFAPAGLSIAGTDIGGQQQGSQRGDVAAAQTISKGISSSYEALAKDLGLVNKKLDVGIFYAMDNAEGGDSLTQLQVTSSAGYNRSKRVGGIENVARGEEELKKALSEETTRVIFEALKTSDLAEKYKAFLNEVSADAGADEMQAAITKITTVKNERAQLEAMLLDLTSTDLEKLTRVRELERAAVSPLNREILEKIYAEQDLTKAIEEQTRAQEELRKATIATNQALGDAVSVAMNAWADSLRTTISELQAVMDKQQGYADALKRFRLSLDIGPLAQLSPEARYNATSAQFNRLSALPVGNEERLAGLEGAGTAFLEASQSYNASSMAYFVDLAKVKGAVQASEGAALTNAQIARMQLTTTQTQLEVLQAIKTNTAGTAVGISAITAALVAQIKSATSPGTTINTGAVATVIGAATGGASFGPGYVAPTGGQATPIGTGTGLTAYTSPAGAVAIMTAGVGGFTLYSKSGAYLGTEADVRAYINAKISQNAGMEIYNDAKAAGFSMSDIDRVMGYAPGYTANAYAAFGLPAFKGGGDHAGGWAMVGEGGPELAYMPPARIYNAQDTQRMVGGTDAQIARLIAVAERQAALVEQLLSVTAAGANGSISAQQRIAAAAEAAETRAMLARSKTTAGARQ